MPHFIDKLAVTGIELGSSVPSVCEAFPPFLDDRGVWIDLDITYSGGFCISMATKCNLMKLKQPSSSSTCDRGVTAKDGRFADLQHFCCSTKWLLLEQQLSMYPHQAGRLKRFRSKLNKSKTVIDHMCHWGADRNPWPGYRMGPLSASLTPQLSTQLVPCFQSNFDKTSQFGEELIAKCLKNNSFITFHIKVIPNCHKHPIFTHNVLCLHSLTL